MFTTGVQSYGSQSLRVARSVAGLLAIPFVWIVLAVAPASAENVILDPIVDEGLVIEVERWVEIPDSSLGRPRINVMATTNGRTFVAEAVSYTHLTLPTKRIV